MDKYYREEILKNLVIIIINCIISYIKFLNKEERSFKYYIKHMFKISKMSLKLSVIFSFIWYAVCMLILRNRNRFLNYVESKCPILVQEINLFFK